MINRLQFNTGRKYSAVGQRIVAVLHDDGVVSFNDIDRMIWGEFKLIGAVFDQRMVMRAYDAGLYQMSIRIKYGTHEWVD